MTNGDTRDVIIPPSSPPTEIEKLVSDIEELKSLGVREVRKGIEELTDKLETRDFEPPPVNLDVHASMIFSPRATCGLPAPRFGSNCEALRYKIEPFDLARAIRRCLPEIKTKAQAKSFLRDLREYLTESTTT